MAGEKNVTIVSQVGTFQAKVENLSGKAEPRKVNGKVLDMKPDGSPKIVYKNAKGEDLRFCRVKDGKPLVTATGENETLSNGYVDPQGNLAQDKQAYYITIDGETLPATKNEKSDVFEIVKFEPLKNFTDKYIIDAYYQIKPTQGKSKSDHQRALTIKANTSGMKKLYDYMAKEQVVGRGVMNITSSGYLPTIAYIRPVDVDGNGAWTLEVGVFKQQKRFTWIGSQEVEDIALEQAEQVVPSIDEI